mmetsp:Transcript_3492/g.6225  ORF Transcript_3492/g.6225 Transcript_3492/m.6225 type:complete len:300 (-) Transcript_3492:963-1862(-)
MGISGLILVLRLEGGVVFGHVGYVERIRQGDSGRVDGLGIVADLGIDKECDRHFNPFTGLQYLHLETEAGDFHKVAAGHERGNIVAGGACDGGVGGVVGLVEGQPGFADADVHMGLHRAELPRHVACRRGIEADADHIVEHRIAAGIGRDRRAAKPGDAAEPVVERHGGGGQAGHDHHDAAELQHRAGLGVHPLAVTSALGRLRRPAHCVSSVIGRTEARGTWSLASSRPPSRTLATVRPKTIAQKPSRQSAVPTLRPIRRLWISCVSVSPFPSAIRSTSRKHRGAVPRSAGTSRAERI